MMSNMADSNAVIQRRKRLHAAGDHSMCSAARCDAVRYGLPPEVPVVDLDLPEGWGPAAKAALQMLAVMPYDADDPRYLIMRTTLALARVFDRAPTAALSAELRRNIAYLTLGMTEIADALDERRSRIVASTADSLIKYALSAVPDSA